MTKTELSQLYYLNREIEQQKRELSMLEAKGSGHVSDIVTGSNADFPYQLKKFYISGEVTSVRDTEEIYELKELIALDIKRCLIERVRLERYIQTVQDSLTRQVLTLRYVNGLSWLQVAMSIGGANTEDSIKKICYRYLKNN